MSEVLSTSPDAEPVAPVSSDAPSDATNATDAESAALASTAAPVATAPPAVKPPKPESTGGPKSWAHYGLYKNVISALYALPGRFHSSLVIEGIRATDLHTMNTALGAAIEQSVVDSLNELRSLWDPKTEYANYSFVRQSQTFPDVLLRTADPDTPKAEQILMGIELKGWFAIAKEEEPSARFYASEGACADADLLVVMPWLFDSVVSGRPRLMKPIIAEAKHVALVRNWWWEFERVSKDKPEERGVNIAKNASIYPSKSHQYSDTPIKDGGGNFGRIARCGVIDDDVEAVSKEMALGIPVRGWARFLSVFSENAEESAIKSALTAIESEYRKHFAVAPEYAVRIAEKCHEIANIIQEGADAAIAAAAAAAAVPARPKRKPKTASVSAAGVTLEAVDGGDTGAASVESTELRADQAESDADAAK